MAAQGYYGDQPRFQRSDPLKKWTWALVAIAVVDLLWMVLLWALWATEAISSRDALFTLEQDTWVGITTAVLVACLIGLFFVIIARLGATSAGGYLSADLDLDDEADVRGSQHPPAPSHLDPDDDEVDAVAEEDLVPPEHVPPPVATSTAKPSARIDDAFGADGRMRMSYTVPEEQPRGIYGDVWVPVDKDAVINVRTLLAKTNVRR